MGNDGKFKCAHIHGNAVNKVKQSLCNSNKLESQDLVGPAFNLLLALAVCLGSMSC